MKRPRRRSTSEGATINYYERHLGDYARDTAHLSLLEHGAYTLLLDRYYVTEKPLPSDERELFRLLRATSKAEKDAVRQVLKEFFEQTREGWRHRRCEEEIERCRDKSSKARSSANARWKGSGPHGGGNANASGTHTERISERNANASKTHDERNALQTPDSRLQTPDPVETSSPDSCVSANLARAKVHTRARSPDLETDARQRFLRLQAAYPKFAGRQDWLAAEHHACRLVDLGRADWPTLLAATQRYAEFVARGGVSGPQYVLTPAKFFGAADEPWTQPWTVPLAAVVPMPRMRKTAAEYEAECPGSTL